MDNSRARRIRVGLAGLGMVLLLAGCQRHTNQAGEQPNGGVVSPAPVQQPGSVPTPPTADQVDPDSPRAVLDGTSTTQDRLKSRPALRPSHP